MKTGVESSNNKSPASYGLFFVNHVPLRCVNSVMKASALSPQPGAAWRRHENDVPITI
jgi:hypothetical protein